MELEANVAIAKQEGNTSFFKTVFHGINAFLGAGILSIPYALASGGWFSLIFLLMIGMAACYSGILTKRCMEMNPNIVTYSDIGEHAFGNVRKTMVSLILYVGFYLALTGYLILEGDNLHSLFPNMKIDAIQREQCFVIIVALFLLPTVWLGDLRVLAYISATGCVATLVIVVAVLWVAVFDGVGFHSTGHVLINWKGIPTAMSLFMFAYGGSPVFPTLYNAMQKKHHFSKVVLIGILNATICYTSIAILGYMMYGSSLRSQITLNLPTEKLSSKIAIYTAWIAPLSKYALMMKPVSSITESWFPIKYQKKRWFKILLRTGLVISQVIVAVSIPFFESLMSLVGTLFTATASITVPCLCYLKISKIKRKSIEGIVIIVLIVLSIVFAVGGTYTSLLSIVKNISYRH